MVSYPHSEQHRQLDFAKWHKSWGSLWSPNRQHRSRL
jgi:hypothetical protein